MNARFVFAACSCAFGSGFQHGYNTGIVNTAQSVLETFINETRIGRNGRGFDRSEMSLVWSIVVSVYCLGATLASFATSPVAEKLGRKKSLQANNAIAVVGGLVVASARWASSYEMIVLGRFLLGINTGLNAGVAPIYLVEIAPVHLRGAVGSVYQLMVVASILFSQIVAHPSVLGSPINWPWAFVLVVFPALAQTVALHFCPESPQYIYGRYKNVDSARTSLVWLRGTTDVQDEFLRMMAQTESSSSSRVSVVDAFRDLHFRRLLRISLVIVLSRQLCGIHALVFFSTDLFMLTGLTEESALSATLAIGVVQVASTCLGVYLVEKCGRRPLYIGGVSGLIIISSFLTVCLALQMSSAFSIVLAVILVFAFAIVYGSSVGSIPWFIVSEMFGSSTRSLANGIAVALNWFTNFLVVFAYLPLENALSGYLFLVHALFLSLSLPYIYLKMPETKQKRSTTDDKSKRLSHQPTDDVRYGRPMPPPSVVLLNVSKL